METIIAILVIIGLLFVAARFVIKNKEQISEIVGGAIGCGILGAIAAFLATRAGVESVNIGAIAMGSGLLGLVAFIASAREELKVKAGRDSRIGSENTGKVLHTKDELKAKAERDSRIESENTIKVLHTKDELKAKAERDSRIESENIVKILETVEGAIRFACDAAIINARISEFEDASAAERAAAKAIEDQLVEAINDSSGRRSEVATEAARIAGIEFAAKTSIDLATKAATLCTKFSPEKRSSAFKESRMAALRATICETDVELAPRGLAKTVQEIERKRSQAVEDARALAEVSEGARIATHVEIDYIQKATESARLVATKEIIGNASDHRSEFMHLVAIEAVISIAVFDTIEAAVEESSADWWPRSIESIIERDLSTIIKNASTVAVADSLRLKLNVPVHNYKQLPKLDAPAGYVYLIKDVSRTHTFKIGRTNHPGTRMNNFGVKLPFKTNVIAILKTDDAKALEQSIHRKFAMQHKRGEWYELTESQVQQIQKM